MRLFKTRIALAIGLLGTGSLALSATTTDTMGVSATVEDSCQLVTSALAFGSFAAIDSTNVDGTTTVDVTCSNGTAYDIGLNAGVNGTTVTDRQMSDGGTGTLNYALYSDSGRTTNWGDTVGTDTVADTGSGATQTKTVYGQIPSGQETAPTGSYTDTITVTVTY